MKEKTPYEYIFQITPGDQIRAYGEATEVSRWSNGKDLHWTVTLPWVKLEWDTSKDQIRRNQDGKTITGTISLVPYVF